jgi:ribosomal protein L29
MAETELAKSQALRQMPEQELQEHLAKLRQERWQGRIKTATSGSQPSHRFAKIRRQIARVLTVLQERHGQARQ